MFFSLPGRVVKPRWKWYQSRTMLIESPPAPPPQKKQDLIRVKDDAHSKLIPIVFPRVQ